MKTALVTGAYKGLGLAWCKLLSQQGYQVILTARTLPRAEEAAAKLNQNTIYPKALDIKDEDQLKELAAWTEQTFGKIDLIINNAGVNPKDYRDKTKMAKAFYLNDLNAAEMLEVIHCNSLAPLLVVKQFRHLLAKSANPLVINTSSWLASVSKLSFGGHYGYVGSKHLLNLFNKSMAFELQQDRIICVAVNPGWVQTDMGGSKATFTAEESVKNIIENVLLKVKISDSGHFLNYDGNIHPW